MSTSVATARDAASTIVESGRALRIVVDGRRRDVLVPPRVRAQHGAELALDITASNASDLTLGDDALEAQLSFAGVSMWCRVPWVAVYGVVDTQSGRGIVVPEHEPPPTLPPEIAAEQHHACSFCGVDRRDAACVVVAPEVAICDRCIADAAGLVARRRHASKLALALAEGAIDLPVAERRDVLLAAAHLAGADLAVLSSVVDQTDPDDPETTLAILSRIPVPSRTAAHRFYESEMLLELGRLAEAAAVLASLPVTPDAPGLDLARQVRGLRVELAAGAEPGRARAVAAALMQLGDCLTELPEHERGWLRSAELLRAVLEAHLRAGDLEEARALAEELVSRAPDDEVARELFLQALTARGDPRQHALREALLSSTDPDGARARRLRSGAR